jgi:integrase
VLTEAAIRALKPKEKPYKRSDSHGLFMLVSVTGARLWRYKYRHGGVERLLALGAYPEISLKLARDKRDEARRQLRDGVDPGLARRRGVDDENFESIAREWISKQAHLSPGTLRRDLDRLESFVFPWLGRRRTRTLTAPDFLHVLRRIEARGTHETAHRTRAVCSRILRYAIATGRTDRDVTADLRGALTPSTSTHYPGITEPKRIGELLRAIDTYRGQPSAEFALRMAPYVFARPGELRRATWSEIDLERAEWRIPAARMKARREHVVPLAHQVVKLLEELQPITGAGKFLFPSLRTNERPMSEVTLNAALRRLGFSKDEHCPHGFRTTASTRLNELGFPPSDIELQLAHRERDETRDAYNRAARLEERKKMMQFWADYLDGLKTGAKVIAIRRKK